VHRIEVLSDDGEFDGTGSTEGTHSGRKRQRQRTSTAAPSLHGVLSSPRGGCIEIMSDDEERSDEGKSDKENAGAPSRAAAGEDRSSVVSSGRLASSISANIVASTSTPPTDGRSSLTFTRRRCCAAYFSPPPPFSSRPNLRPKVKATDSPLSRLTVSLYITSGGCWK